MLENMSQTEGVETLPSGVRVHILDKPTGSGEGSGGSERKGKPVAPRKLAG